MARVIASTTLQKVGRATFFFVNLVNNVNSVRVNVKLLILIS